MSTPDIKVVKLRIRRGTDNQRKQIVLDQGELGFTTDTKRLFIGDGGALGGVPVGNNLNTTLSLYNSLSDTVAEVGDVVLVDGVQYQLKYSSYNELSSWSLFSPQPDNNYLQYSGLSSGPLTIRTGSIDGQALNQGALSSTSILFTGNSIAVNYNTDSFTISANKLALNTNSILPIHISPTVISSGLSGLSGGSGTPLYVNVDKTTIDYTPQGQLTVISTPITALRYQDLGPGFNIDVSTRRISASIVGVDSKYFALCSGVVTWTGFNINAPVEALIGNDTGNRTFNGSPTLPGYGGFPTLSANTGILSARKSTGETIQLSAAGWQVFEGNAFTNYRQFAIPIFLLPQ